jgi:hypothetical protein
VRRLAMVSVLALVAAACASPVPTPLPPQPSVPSVEWIGLPLPTGPSLQRVTFLGACTGIGLVGATLNGDPEDPRVAWLDVQGSGRREIVFPPNFTARFAPRLEVLDGSGAVVARAGDPIDGGCLTGSLNDPLLILAR